MQLQPEPEPELELQLELPPKLELAGPQPVPRRLTTTTLKSCMGACTRTTTCVAPRTRSLCVGWSSCRHPPPPPRALSCPVQNEKEVPATISGMLGGMEFVSDDDIAESRELLTGLAAGGRPGLRLGRALDCGAGIGRISKLLLCPLFGEGVDLQEQSDRFRAAARAYVADDKLLELHGGTMQDFEPPPGMYDVVWVQWVIGYFTDVHLMDIVRRYTRALRPGGVMVIKDNTIESRAFHVDQDDAYLIRSAAYQEELFRRAGVRVVKKEFQRKWPQAAFPVVSFVLAAAGTEGDAAGGSAAAVATAP